MHRTIQLVCCLGGVLSLGLSAWLAYEWAVLAQAGLPLPVSRVEAAIAFVLLLAAGFAFGVISDSAAKHADRR